MYISPLSELNIEITHFPQSFSNMSNMQFMSHVVKIK